MDLPLEADALRRLREAAHEWSNRIQQALATEPGRALPPAALARLLASVTAQPGQDGERAVVRAFAVEASIDVALGPIDGAELLRCYRGLGPPVPPEYWQAYRESGHRLGRFAPVGLEFAERCDAAASGAALLDLVCAGVVEFCSVLCEAATLVVRHAAT